MSSMYYILKINYCRGGIFLYQLTKNKILIRKIGRHNINDQDKTKRQINPLIIKIMPPNISFFQEIIKIAVNI